MPKTKTKTKESVEIHPLEPKRWQDLEKLFGPAGADRGCWCMFWRLRQKDYALGSSEKNHAAQKKMVAEGKPTGLLAYVDGQPVGWCGVSPRPAFARLDASNLIPASTDPATWSVVCLFIDRKARSQGVGLALLKGAVEHAKAQGAKAVEAYPVDSAGEKVPAKNAYPGTVPMFQAAGFKKVSSTEAKSAGYPRAVVRVSLK